MKIIIERKKQSEDKKLFEFSKKVIVAMTVLVFATAIFAIIMIWRLNGLYLDNFLNFVEIVAGIPLFGYCLKNVFENPAKIKAQATREINKTLNTIENGGNIRGGM